MFTPILLLDKPLFYSCFAIKNDNTQFYKKYTENKI
ncbi:hypothetical protein IMCC3317_46080 [Kordia antarctica]|uniref:Uncharacterized protein n=1 Tax=Kordia antarctica TaxID=1218801 RepID=A0A7L4ZR62_9FLAO|nr:hypothetical protein IMCC3317_46080 [Kordia antarctica]